MPPTPPDTALQPTTRRITVSDFRRVVEAWYFDIDPDNQDAAVVSLAHELLTRQTGSFRAYRLLQETILIALFIYGCDTSNIQGRD